MSIANRFPPPRRASQPELLHELQSVVAQIENADRRADRTELLIRLMAITAPLIGMQLAPRH